MNWPALLDALRTSDSEELMLSQLASWGAEQAGADECDIYRPKDEAHWVLAASTVAPEFVGRMVLGKGKGLVGMAAESRQRILVPKDLTNHPNFVRYTGFDQEHCQSACITPLMTPEGVQAVVSFRRVTPWTLTPDEDANLTEISDALSQAISTYIAVRTSADQGDKLEAVAELTRTLTSSPYLEEILQLLVNLTAQQFGYRVCTVRLLDEKNHELVLRATQATVRAYQRKRAIKLGESIAGRVVQTKETIIVSDVQSDPDYIGHDLAVEQGLRSMICVPLVMQDRAVGVMTCYTDFVRLFPQEEIEALETIAHQAAVAIEHAKLQVRNTLMQEMHHRVKNNLQQVVSLLRLQLRHKHYKSIEDAINDSLSRILAIASVHDLLSREDLDYVGLKSIAESLVQHQQQSFILPDRHISFKVTGTDFRLNMNQATQVALVLNELIQNAVEHGFKIAQEGDIHVSIEEKDDWVQIWVSNDGDKLPEGFDPSVAAHLGIQIVSNLARALGGTFTIEDKQGWAVAHITFPVATSE